MRAVLYEDDDHLLYEEDDYYYEDKQTGRVESLSEESAEMHLRYFSE
ncbi:MAG: hypothetical protein ABEJ78_01915 [Haloferacaceae archaeon]